MIISKNRIRSLNYFKSADENSPIHIKVENIERFKEQMKAFGFDESDKNGTSILPNCTNNYTKKNAEPFFTVDKNLPKEDYDQTVLWTRTEWAGRGMVNTVTDFSFFTKKRYHRDYFPPFSVYFTLVTDTEEPPYIISDEISYIEDNHDKLLNTVNMVLGTFGECTIDISDQSHDVKRIRVNWDILPQGDMPWETIRNTLKKRSNGSSNSISELLLRNCEKIYDYKPDFVAYGRSGFKGYAVFGFTDRNLYILESSVPGNATYVFKNDWETLSRLTKAEILSNDLHMARIIHSKAWDKKLKEIMGEVYA